MATSWRENKYEKTTHCEAVRPGRGVTAFLVWSAIIQDCTVMRHFSPKMTLESLEQSVWQLPENATPLMVRCHRLRKKPLGEFRIEDLRLMIGQRIGLSFLLPMAIEKLRKNLFAEGDLYEGDLLSAILRIEPMFWELHPMLHREVLKLMRGRTAELEDQRIRWKQFPGLRNL